MKRIESDLIGSMEVPAEALYGVQTLRGIENFPISCFHLCDYQLFINGLAITKLGAAIANHQLGLLTDEQFNAIAQACKEILAGQHHEQFPVDMIQGGAGTTTNMNANEVIANRALQIMGHQPGEYQYCSPNDHVNCSQSTNDAYPTAIHIGLYATHLEFTYDVNSLLEVEVFVHSSKLRRKILIQGNKSRLSQEEAEKRMEALQYLKQNPRDEEPNRLVLLRGERLYEEATGENRRAIDRAMMEFDRALKKQDRTEIERARGKLEDFLNDMEFGS